MVTSPALSRPQTGRAPARCWIRARPLRSDPAYNVTRMSRDTCSWRPCSRDARRHHPVGLPRRPPPPPAAAICNESEQLCNTSERRIPCQWCAPPGSAVRQRRVRMFMRSESPRIQLTSSAACLVENDGHGRPWVPRLPPSRAVDSRCRLWDFPRGSFNPQPPREVGVVGDCPEVCMRSR